MRQPPSPFRKIKRAAQSCFRNTANLQPRGVFMMTPLYSFDLLRQKEGCPRDHSPREMPLRAGSGQASLFQKEGCPHRNGTAQGDAAPQCWSGQITNALTVVLVSPKYEGRPTAAFGQHTSRLV